MTRATAGEKAYEAIKRKILFLELEPGSVVNESNLIEELQIGRSPIRDALRRLEQEDLIIILPRQGTLVSDVSLSDFRDIFEMRCELEGFAAYLAAKRAKPSHLRALTQLILDAEAHSQDGNNEIDLTIDGKFHQIVREASTNKYLSKTLTKLFNHSVRLFNLSRTRSASVREEIPDYRAMLECFQDRKADKARGWMEAHIIAAQKRIQASFSAFGMIE